MSKSYCDKELLYSATARCRCGAGLAYPLNHEEAMKRQAWDCSAVLKGEIGDGPLSDHESFPFNYCKVREETSINNRGRLTTRPSGTRCLTVGYAACPQCNWRWKSDPYEAGGLHHHWFPGDCPECGYGVGGHGRYATGEGKPIDVRYKNVVVTANDAAAT